MFLAGDKANMSASYNLKQCENLIALAEMFGLTVNHYGIHGTVPFIAIKVDDHYAYVYEFTHYQGASSFIADIALMDALPVDPEYAPLSGFRVNI